MADMEIIDQGTEKERNEELIAGKQTYRTLDAAIANVKGGTFKADDYGRYSFMKEGGCSLAPLGTFDAKVPAEVKALVAEKEKAIKDGSFTVAIDDSEPKSS